MRTRILTICMFSVIISSNAFGILWRHDVPEAEYIALAQQPQFSGVAKIRVWTTGVVIHDGWWVLTCAHGSLPMPGFPITVGSEVYRAQQVYIHPLWDYDRPRYEYDLALVRLDRPVASDVYRAPIYTRRDEVGKVGWGVGYGVGGTGLTGYDERNYPFGTKRAMQNVIASLSGSNFIVQVFDNPASGNALPYEGTGGPGDSGAPVFIEENGVWSVAGIIVLGGGGRYGESLLSVRVSSHAPWIYSIVAPEPSSLAILVGIASGYALLRRRRRLGIIKGTGVSVLLVFGALCFSYAQSKPLIKWMRGGHAGRVLSVACSPDGQMIASGSADGTIKIWRASDGTLIRTLVGHLSAVNGVAFSNDGTLLVSGSSDVTTRIWRVSDGRLLHTMTIQWWTQVRSVAFSPTNSTLAASAVEGEIVLWDALTGNYTQYFSHGAIVDCIAFAPSGNLIASGGRNGKIRIWDIVNRSLVAELDNVQRVSGLAFSPNGSLLISVSTPGQLRIWDLSDGQLLSTTSISDTWLCLAVSPTGNLLAIGGSSGTIRIYEIDNPRNPRNIRNISVSPSRNIHALAFSPDGIHVVSGGGDSFSGIMPHNRHVQIWNVSDGTLSRQITDHSDYVEDIAFFPDGNQLVTASWDGTIKVRRSSDGHPLLTIQRYEPVSSVSVAGSLIAAGNLSSSTVSIINLSDGSTSRLSGHSHWVSDVAFSPTNPGTLASASWDNTVRLWDVSTGTLQQTLSGHSNIVNKLAFSPDANFLATASADNTLRLWAVDQGTLLHTFVGHTQSVNAVAFSPDGNLLASGGHDDNIILWHVPTRSRLRTLSGHRAQITSLAFSPDGRFLLSGGGTMDATLRLWRVSDGALLYTYDQETGTGIRSVAFSPDGQYFVYGRYDATVVWAQNPCARTDVNNDGCVNDIDLLLVLFDFASTGDGLLTDLNCDGIVDDSDLLKVLIHFATGC
jgi:WD40 repeat protein